MIDLATVQLRPQTGRMTVLAGESAEQQISLSNFSSLPDSFDLRIEGLPPGWYSFSRTNVSLFPNWSEPVSLRIEVSDKVRPDIYPCKLVAASTGQPGVQGEVELEIEVLAPLRVDARLQPRRASGYKAAYSLVLRNRSMCEGMMGLELSPSNPYCLGLFPPGPVRILAGQSLTVPFKVQLRPKIPKDEGRQLQNFEVQIQPQWNVNGQAMATPPLIIEGEYEPRSRWAFIARHPKLFIIPLILLVLVLLWFFVIQPRIQDGLVLLADRVSFQKTDPDFLRIEQNGLNNRIQNEINPLAAAVKITVKFSEDTQNTQITMNYLIFSSTLNGTLFLNPATGDLDFKAKNMNAFPWFLVPPDRIAKAISKNLKPWLAKQGQRMDRIEIEGNTLFIRLKSCNTSGVVCT